LPASLLARDHAAMLREIASPNGEIGFVTGSTRAA
jgi:hypothetical protein